MKTRRQLRLICLLLIIIKIILLSLITSNESQQQQQQQQSQIPPIKILVLFSETTNDLGIDHRIGRQIIRLATQRAKQLNPRLEEIEIKFISDDVECSGSSKIPNEVAQYFYSQQSVCTGIYPIAEGKVCDNINISSMIENEDSTELDLLMADNARINDRGGGGGEPKSSSEAYRISNRKSVDAIIGPSCDFLVDFVARMAAYWRTPIYSVASIGTKFSRKDIYPTLTRLSPSIDHLCMFMIRTMEHFKWNHLAIIVDDKQVDSRIVLENLEYRLARIRHLIPIERKKLYFDSFRSSQNEPSSNSSYFSSSCSDSSRQVLLEARKVARVILLLLNQGSTIRRLLLCAYELGFNNGEFTFMALNLGLSVAPVSQYNQMDSIESNSVSSSSGQQSGSGSSIQNGQTEKSIVWYKADDEEGNKRARIMFESLMVYSAELPISSEFDLLSDQAIELAQREFPGIKFTRQSIGSMAVALHDSLLLAVEAHVRRFDSLNLTYESKKSPNSMYSNELNKFSVQESHDIGDLGETYEGPPVALIWNESFYDGLVSNMHINANGDQELDYILSDMEPESGIMRPVATYSKETRQIKTIDTSYIHWPARVNALTRQLIKDRPPPDEPECGFNEDADHCIDRQNMYLALSLTGALIVLALLSGLFGWFRYKQIKYHMRLDDYWWKIDWNDLEFVQLTDIDCGSMVSAGQSIVRALKSSHSGSMVSGQMSVRRASNRMNPANKHNDSIPNVVITEGDEKVIGNPVIKKSQLSVGETKTQSIVGTQSQFIGTKSMFSSVVKESSIATYKDDVVIVKLLACDSLEISRELLVDLKSMRDHLSDNLAKFVGLCIQPGRMSIVYEFCSRGNLQTLLLNDSFALDWTLKYSIIGDILNGLNYIHSTQLDYHGRLKSTNLVLDSRFTVKITDFGLQSLYSQLKSIEPDIEGEEEFEYGDETIDRDDFRGNKSASSLRQADILSLSVSQIGYNQNRSNSEAESRKHMSIEPDRIKKNRAKFKGRSSARHLWTAPEHLRARESHTSGSKKGDIYSLAIILIEILTRKEPYHFGSNARPFWPAIREEKGKQTTRRGSQNPNQGDISIQGSRANKRESVQLKNRFKRLSASVGPSDGADTQSIASSVQGSEIKTIPGRRGKALIADNLMMEEIATSDSGTKISREDDTKIDIVEILDQIRMGIQPEPVRPYLPNFLIQEVDPRFIELIRSCWHESSASRPAINKVKNQLRVITKGLTAKNYLDNLLDRLQEYAADLERILDEKSGDIIEEKRRTENILNKLVPRFVADRLRRCEPIVPQLFEGVTIYFSDIIGFEKYAAILTPIDLVQLLNSLYYSFDSVIDSFDVTKIETIIDIFLIASGIKLEPAPEQNNRLELDENQANSNNSNNNNNSKTMSEHPGTKKRSAGKLLASLRPLKSTQSASDQVENTINHQGIGTTSTTAAGGVAVAALGASTTPMTTDDKSQYWRSSAEQIARMALSLRAMINAFRFNPTSSASPPVQLNIRIGIHSGKVCAGIVGVKRPKFCLIGDTVNVASRMHTNSKANKIQISCDTRQLLDQSQGFDIQSRGKIEVKGKGMMDTFWLEYAC